MANKNSKESQISEIPESYQRYLDEIYIISRKKKGGWVSNKELAENLDIKPASVSGMLEKLKKQGLIDWRPRKLIRLTEKGKTIARQLNETHELLRDFFIKVLEIPDEEVVDNISCQIEHHISWSIKKKLKEFLSKYLKEI
ncbi:MAG: metal-dependent transcriptional regulator [Candidatus Thorarchaeota archaeon]